MGPHTTSDDPTRYQPAEELTEWAARDPITRYRNYLQRIGVLTDRLEQRVAARSARLRAYAEITPLLAAQRVLVFGEDVATLGGVFRITEGLSETFGAKRCFDTPLAESAIIGIGAVEHHSESTETYWVHTAGLKVVVPSTPSDAYWLLRHAISSRDPVVYLEPDLRSLSPLDFDTVAASVRKTGRAVVMHEGPRTLGFDTELNQTLCTVETNKAEVEIPNPYIGWTSRPSC
jgi:pyruvate/2-oxoglutarate/acetoin dehydrogenase E1 component